MAAARPSFGRVRVLGTGRWRPPLRQRQAPRIIAVGSASAGAGKSVVASNLAIAIAGLGAQVVLVDFDLAAPRLHDLFGIERPGRGLQAALDRDKTALDVSLTSTSIRNLQLATGVAGGRLDLEQKGELIRQLYELEGDVIIVDVGPGNRDDLFDFFAMGALRLLVSASHPEALETTFAFLKGAVGRAASRYGAEAARALGRFQGRLVGNQASAPEDVEAFHGFSRLVREHLALPLPVLGCLRGSDRIQQSIGARRPLLARGGLDENVRTFHEMAELLMMGGPGESGEDHCDLGAPEPLTVERAALPADLRRYLRKHPRYPVDWTARLELHGITAQVRVLDVSYSGAGIEVFGDIGVAAPAVLCFHQLPGQPALPVTVKNVLPGVHRAGLAFVQPGEISSRLVAAAVALADPAANVL